jgi:UDP-N-acetyl-D-glucosamine dehydrogenase
MIDSVKYKKKVLSLISKKKARIGIIGLGYVGLPLAILFAKKGFKIFGFDNNLKKIKSLNDNLSYIERISNKDIILLNKNENRCFSNFKKIEKCDIIIICVPTPLKRNNIPDLSFIKKTINDILGYIKHGQTIILESTSYPGTTEEEVIKKINKKFTIGKNFFVGFSSERINPGVNENKISSIPKVVSGHSKSCLKVVSEIYKKVFSKIVKANTIKIAEFSKLLENIYRAVNIGFINEMKFVADKMGIDIFEIIKIASTKPYGFRPFHPGPGIGGHCIPIDPHYLYWKAKKNGISANFIKLSAETNSKVINFINKKVFKIISDLKIKKNKTKILILGFAYKKNMDDIRESASIKLAETLKNNDFKHLSYCDPHIKDQINKNRHKFLKKIKKLSPSLIKKFDIVIIMTDHDIFNYSMIKKYSKKIIDCRGRYNTDNRIIRG